MLLSKGLGVWRWFGGAREGVLKGLLLYSTLVWRVESELLMHVSTASGRCSTLERYFQWSLFEVPKRKFPVKNNKSYLLERWVQNMQSIVQSLARSTEKCFALPALFLRDKMASSSSFSSSQRAAFPKP